MLPVLLSLASSPLFPVGTFFHSRLSLLPPFSSIRLQSSLVALLSSTGQAGSRARLAEAAILRRGLPDWGLNGEAGEEEKEEGLEDLGEKLAAASQSVDHRRLMPNTKSL